jgi:hypothetical protein
MTISAVSQASNVGGGAAGILPGMFVYANDGSNHLPNGGNPPEITSSDNDKDQLVGWGHTGWFNGDTGVSRFHSAQICPLLRIGWCSEINDYNNTDGVIPRLPLLFGCETAGCLSTNTLTGMLGTFTEWDGKQPSLVIQ